MSEILTDLTLRKLLPRGSSRVEIWDAKVSGFGVRVSPSGSKSFVLVYRHKGRPRRMTLGKYPLMGLAVARELALTALRDAKAGVDPQTEKVVAKTGTRFDKTVDLFIATYCASNNRDSTRREKERLLKARFVSQWGARDLREITKADVLAILDAAIADALPSAANHALAEIRHFFNWCLDRGLIETNPCSRIKRPARATTRERVLADDEIAHVWQAAEKVGYPFGSIVRLLLLTGQRRGEVTKMQWADIDIKNRVWVIPGGSTKNGVAHVVPLTPAAVAIIKAVPHIDREFVFPARGSEGNTFSGFSKNKRWLDRAMIAAMSIGQEEPAELEPWTLHDLRRTASTGMAGLGVAPHVIERLLNHVSGVLGGVAGVYNRFKYAEEVRAALELWTAHVLQVSETPRG